MRLSLRRLASVGLAVLAFTQVVGCTQWMRIRDNTNNVTYITNDQNYKLNKDTDKIRFKDMRTKKTIVLDEYEIEDITKEEAMSAIAK